MTNKTAKRSLVLSVISLLLCCSMLIGTTFAWFTDSVATTNNVITAGNLDVNLYYKTTAMSDWAAVEADTDVFSGNLWEPGHTEVVYLKVVNEGTLALKYDLIVNVASEVAGTNVAGETFNLSDYILYNVYEGVKTYADSAAARGEETGKKLNVPYNKASQLLNKGESVELTLVAFMPTTVGNEANYKTGTTAPSINLGINLFANQYTKEQDSFGPDYDADAKPVVIYTAADLAAALTADEEVISVILGNDIDLPRNLLIGGNEGDEYKMGSANTKAITINLNGNRLNVTTTYWSVLGTVNPETVVTIANGAMTSSQATGTWNSYDLMFASGNFVFENVKFEKSVALETNAVLKNVTINETHDYYALWITAEGQTVEIDGLTVNSLGRGIKIDEQYVDAPAKVTLNVANATFNTNKKAAIVVKSVAGADIALNNVNIDNTPDATHAVWVDEDAAAYYDLVTVTGGLKAAEGDMITSAADLQAALDAATGETTIYLGGSITGNVTVTQKPDVKVTIEGNGNEFNGILTVDGKSARYETAALTIKNVNFVGQTKGADDAYIKLGGDNSKRYTNNVTVKDCTFSGDQMVAVKSYTGGDWNLTIEGCTVNAGMHSLAQLANVEKGLKIADCKVYSKNGANLNQTLSLEMSGCAFDVQGYAVRFGSNGAENAEQKTFAIINSTLKSACAEADDAVIVFRGTATNAKLTLTGTTLEGTCEIMGNTASTIIE